jgi:hypothetical protein
VVLPVGASRTLVVFRESVTLPFGKKYSDTGRHSRWRGSAHEKQHRKQGEDAEITCGPFNRRR